MTLLDDKILAAVLIFVIALLAVVYPLKKNMARGQWSESSQLMEALASGIFLGAAFFHLLPEAIRQFLAYAHPIRYPFPELICVIGFLIPLFLERISFVFDSEKTNHAIAYIVFFVLSIHAITEGAAIGVSHAVSETIFIAIAIATHKGSECFALCMVLLKQSFPIKKIIYILIAFACVTPIGIFLGNETLVLTSFNQSLLLPACINAFAAGTFLYISTLHHTHFHEHKGEWRGFIEFIALVFGVLIMGILSIWN